MARVAPSSASCVTIASVSMQGTSALMCNGPQVVEHTQLRASGRSRPRERLHPLRGAWRAARPTIAEVRFIHAPKPHRHAPVNLAFVRQVVARHRDVFKGADVLLSTEPSKPVRVSPFPSPKDTPVRICLCAIGRLLVLSTPNPSALSVQRHDDFVQPQDKTHMNTRSRATWNEAIFAARLEIVASGEYARWNPYTITTGPGLVT